MNWIVGIVIELYFLQDFLIKNTAEEFSDTTAVNDTIQLKFINAHDIYFALQFSL